mmetsp:Transcript_31899/g.73215  ORF Transcript_31899/g.73215 Transcript_31899/m.73215 type:complete len:356 (-) Transcript_31899:1163-2230(-)
MPGTPRSSRWRDVGSVLAVWRLAKVSSASTLVVTRCGHITRQGHWAVTCCLVFPVTHSAHVQPFVAGVGGPWAAVATSPSTAFGKEGRRIAVGVTAEGSGLWWRVDHHRLWLWHFRHVHPQVGVSFELAHGLLHALDSCATSQLQLHVVELQCLVPGHELHVFQTLLVQLLLGELLQLGRLSTLSLQSFLHGPLDASLILKLLAHRGDLCFGSQHFLVVLVCTCLQELLDCCLVHTSRKSQVPQVLFDINQPHDKSGAIMEQLGDTLGNTTCFILFFSLMGRPCGWWCCLVPISVSDRWQHNRPLLLHPTQVLLQIFHLLPQLLDNPLVLADMVLHSLDVLRDSRLYVLGAVSIF